MPNYKERDALRKRLRDLARAAHETKRSEFVKTRIAQEAWLGTIIPIWTAFLADAKTAGYKKITVGSHKSWPDARDCMLFAEPYNKSTASPGPVSRPMLWVLADKHFGGFSCGNGLSKAIQCQLDISMALFQGEHVL